MLATTKRCTERRSPLSADQQLMASQHLSIARVLARQHSKRCGLDADELEGTASLALVEAAQTYNPARGIRFGTYARHRIDGAIRDSIRVMLTERRASEKKDFEDDEYPTRTRMGRFRFEDRDRDFVDAVDTVENWLKKLPPQHAAACRQIYVEGLPQVKAADWLACSKSRLSALHKEAIAMLNGSWYLRIRLLATIE